MGNSGESDSFFFMALATFAFTSLIGFFQLGISTTRDISDIVRLSLHRRCSADLWRPCCQCDYHGSSFRHLNFKSSSDNMLESLSLTVLVHAASTKNAFQNGGENRYLFWFFIWMCLTKINTFWDWSHAQRHHYCHVHAGNSSSIF